MRARNLTLRSHSPALRGAIAVGGLLAFALLCAVEARAEEVWSSVRFPTEYRSVTVESETDTTDVTQAYVPVVASLRFGRQLDFVLAGAFAQSTVSPDSRDDLSLSGMSDVTAQLFCRLAGNRVLLQGGLGLPTGKKELDDEELAVAQSLAHPLFGFRMKTYGQGLDLSAGAAAALPLGERASLGVGAGFVSHGAFTLVEGGDDYKPGLESSVSVGLDLGGRARGKGNASGSGAPLRVDASYRAFGKDQLDGEDLFQEGAQIEGQAALAFGSRGPRFNALGRVVSKSDNTSFVDNAGDIEELKEKPGTSLRGEASFDFPLSPSVRLGLMGEAQSFTDSDETALNGSIVGGGPVLSILFGKSGGLRLAGEYLTGSIDEDKEIDRAKVDLSGFSASLGLTLRSAN